MNQAESKETTAEVKGFHSVENAQESNKETITRLTRQQNERDELVQKIHAIKPALNSINKAFDCFKNARVSVMVDEITPAVLKEVAVLLDLKAELFSAKYWAHIHLEGGTINLRSKQVKTATIEIEE